MLEKVNPKGIIGVFFAATPTFIIYTGGVHFGKESR